MKLKKWLFLIEVIKLKLNGSYDLLDLCKAMDEMQIELKDLFKQSKR